MHDLTHCRHGNMPVLGREGFQVVVYFLHACITYIPYIVFCHFFVQEKEEDHVHPGGVLYLCMHGIRCVCLYFVMPVWKGEWLCSHACDCHAVLQQHGSFPSSPHLWQANTFLISSLSSSLPHLPPSSLPTSEEHLTLQLAGSRKRTCLLWRRRNFCLCDLLFKQPLPTHGTTLILHGISTLLVWRISVHMFPPHTCPSMEKEFLSSLSVCFIHLSGGGGWSLASVFLWLHHLVSHSLWFMEEERRSVYITSMKNKTKTKHSFRSISLISLSLSHLYCLSLSTYLCNCEISPVSFLPVLLLLHTTFLPLHLSWSGGILSPSLPAHLPAVPLLPTALHLCLSLPLIYIYTHLPFLGEGRRENSILSPC